MTQFTKPSLQKHIDECRNDLRGIDNEETCAICDGRYIRVEVCNNARLDQPYHPWSLTPEEKNQYKELAHTYLKKYFTDVDQVVGTDVCNFGLMYGNVVIGVFKGFEHIANIKIDTRKLIDALAPSIFDEQIEDTDLGKYIAYRRRYLQHTLAIRRPGNASLSQMIGDRIGFSVFVEPISDIDFTKISTVERTCIDLWFGVEETLQFDY